MKKKVAAIFMASIMAFSLAAAEATGGSSDSGKTDSGDKSTAASTADTGSGEVEKIIVSFQPGPRSGRYRESTGSHQRYHT